MRILITCGIIIFLFFHCKTPDQNYEVAFFSYYIRGHEDITRFAIDLANEQLQRDYKIQDFYPEEPSFTIISDEAEAPNKSTNPLVYGNVAIDFPKQIVFNGLKFSDFFPEVQVDSDWLENGTQQNFHFMRNFSENSDENTLSVQSAQECLGNSTDLILNFSGRAGRYWNKAQQFSDDPKVAEANRDAAFFLIGSALHTIQDSFSKGHVTRTGDFTRILDICVLRTVDGICGHRLELELKDDIWKNPLTGRITRNWSDLNPEAQKAAQISARYLVHLALIFTKNKSEQWSENQESAIKSKIKEFLRNPTFDQGFSGYFNLQSN